ncbi:hypothetical protein AB0W38_02080 [Aliarcobacter butzleri]|uniref:hypothetical protein n=1 Tax=Aliarcobacter butzleri TaxID=28197 RepID=UPI00344C93E7
MYGKLKYIIKKEAILKNYNSSINSFCIKENDKLAKCKKVELVGFENESTTFCFELDSKDKNIKCGKYHKLSPYFNDGIDLDKGNDAIIFTRIENIDYIFISELKDDSKSSEIIKQLKSSTCFVEYLKSILKNIYDIENVDKIIIRYLVFSMSGNNLRPTGMTRRKAINKSGLSIYFSNCCERHNIKSFI